MLRKTHPIPKTTERAEPVGRLAANVKGEAPRFGHIFRNVQPIEIVGEQ
jgi:hypothetical protein